MKTIFIIISCCLPVIIARAEDNRIWVEAKINSKTAYFIFDTGYSGYYALFRNAAERLGIAITNYIDPNDTNRLYTGYTPECSLQIRDETLNAPFRIVDLPPVLTNRLSADGLIGWHCITNSVVMIDAETQTVLQFSHVPPDARDWLKLPLQAGAPVLRLLVSNPGGKKSVVVVDTGSDSGIALRSDIWRNWRLSHTNQPATLTEKYSWGPGKTVREEAWAKEITVGPLILTDVPVVEANSVDRSMGGDSYEATLGLAALKRLDLVVDARHGVAYLHPKNDKIP